MDELQLPIGKRRSTAMDVLPGQRRRLAKKTKLAGDLPALSQSPSTSSFNNFPLISSSRTPRTPSGKNTQAGPSTKSNAASHNDLMTPTRVSSRVSRPTLKKKVFEQKPHSSESDGTPPRSIIPPTPPLFLKRKRLTSSPVKRPAGNTTPSKRKRLDPNPTELTSDDDGSQAQPPQKRVKHTHKKPLNFSSDVIDLCSESEDVTSSPTRTRTRDEESVIVVLSTDEEVDLEFSSFSRLAFEETDTKTSPTLSPLRDISPLVDEKPASRASPSPQSHNTSVPKPKAPLANEDGVTNEDSVFVEKVDFQRGSLQALYNAALARCTRELHHVKDINNQPTRSFSFKCIPPMPSIRYPTHNQSPALHTPLFFDRMILGLRARLELPHKTLNTTAFSEDTCLDSMAASKHNEEQEDTQTYSNAIMEISATNGEAPEAATKTMLVPPIDLHDDVLSDAQAARISPTINDLDVDERPVPTALESPSPSVKQESPLLSEVKHTPIANSIQAQEGSANHKTATPERESSSAISPNMLPKNSSNPDAVTYQIGTSQEAETLLFRIENQVATIDSSVLQDAHFLVQTLRRRYDASNVSGCSLLPAELNDRAEPSAAPEPLSESPVICTEHATTTKISSLTISNSEDTPSISERFSESLVMLTDHATKRDISLFSTEDASSASEYSGMPATMQNLSLLPGSNSEDASPGECHSESPAVLTEHATTLNLSSLASLNSDNLVTPDDSPSPHTPPVKQKPLIYPNPSPPSNVSFFKFDTDLFELNLRMLMGNRTFDEDDDDDISVSGLELVYPEETY